MTKEEANKYIERLYIEAKPIRELEIQCNEIKTKNDNELREQFSKLRKQAYKGLGKLELKDRLDFERKIEQELEPQFDKLRGQITYQLHSQLTSLDDKAIELVGNPIDYYLMITSKEIIKQKKLYLTKEEIMNRLSELNSIRDDFIFEAIKTKPLEELKEFYFQHTRVMVFGFGEF